MKTQSCACGCEVPVRDKDGNKNFMKCARCNQIFCMSHIYSYVDENNGSITRNSREYCKECYKIIYK